MKKHIVIAVLLAAAFGAAKQAAAINLSVALDSQLSPLTCEELAALRGDADRWDALIRGETDEGYDELVVNPQKWSEVAKSGFQHLMGASTDLTIDAELRQLKFSFYWQERGCGQ